MTDDGASYAGLWHTYVGGLSLEHWINDALMAVFFLFIGLELERELYVGELSDFRNALLPIVAALGGIAVPALIHFSLNAGTPTQPGVGIPMATDTRPTSRPPTYWARSRSSRCSSRSTDTRA